MENSFKSKFLTSTTLLLICSTFVLAGCNAEAPADSSSEISGQSTSDRSGSTSDPAMQELYASCLETASLYQDIYDRALKADNLDTLETYQEIISRLGDAGFCAADTDSQINMENSDQLENFLTDAQSGRTAEASTLLVTQGAGIVYYKFHTQEGDLHVQRCTLYWENESAKAGYYEAFTAEKWLYTENGWFFFDQYRMPGYDGPPGEIGIRVKPLDSECREYNRKYVLPVGYNRNSMLIIDWSESDGFGTLNFYDLYDLMYRMKYGTEAPYPYAYTGAEYEIPASEFDSVLQSYLNIHTDTIRSRTVYYPERGTYQYRPRGLEDAEYTYGPFPEVTARETQPDGTLKLTVQAVQVTNFTDHAITSELLIRPLPDGSFQYVSNHVTEIIDGISGTWYTPRLTEDEWNNKYL